MKIAVKMMPIDQINVSEIKIRGVNLKDENFIGLMTDIGERHKRGDSDYVQMPVTVRVVPNPASPEEKIIELVDGLQRLTACKELGITEIPAINKGEMSTMDALRAQFAMNSHRIAQKPAAEGQQFSRMLIEDSKLTLAELCALVGKNANYVQKRMLISDKLIDQAQKLVDDGSINMLNAKALCELPKEEQANYVEDAIRLPHGEFGPQVHARAREMRAAVNAGKNPKAVEFIASPHNRRQSDILDEIKSKATAMAYFKDQKEQAAFLEGCKWSVELDGPTVAAKKEKWEAVQAERKRRSAAIKAAAQQKKLEEAKKKADEIQAEIAAASK